MRFCSLSLVLLFISLEVTSVAQEYNHMGSADTATNGSANGATSPPPPVVLPKDSLMKTAYHDALSILSVDNRCSGFFGGPAIATTVLDDFIGHVQYGYLPVATSFEMKGEGTDVRDLNSGAHYRRFARMTVNYRGAFYKDRNFSAERTPRVGSFSPNTRSARALILLHELGHLINRNGNWLIPDDGSDSWRSAENSRLIEQTCREQLRWLQ